ncbi:hypothetical protein [Candidatus Palauibacter sp.]|uniref:hypothetical protein n=1 Tax=Candidatus Palauibacter sp. TaxID=3101350 RepID=UPI003B0281FB
MCAILDADVAGEVFGAKRTPAGRQFFEWLETPGARLVVGGKLYRELVRNVAFERWVVTALADGRARREPAPKVDERAAALEGNASLKSNDAHVIALADIGGARILYSVDGDLRDDFTNATLLSNPRGKLYPTGESPNADRHRHRLLGRTDLCPNRG